MEWFFSPDGQWVWTALLCVALFFPVRQLIFVMSVRRAQRKSDSSLEDSAIRSLRKRAAFTAGLLCFVFGVLYVHVIFDRLYGP